MTETKAWQRRVARSIREWREHCGLTKAELADEVGVHPSNVGRWESAQVMPYLASLEAVAKACGLRRFEDLLTTRPR